MLYHQMKGLLREGKLEIEHTSDKKVFYPNYNVRSSWIFLVVRSYKVSTKSTIPGAFL